MTVKVSTERRNDKVKRSDEHVIGDECGMPRRVGAALVAIQPNFDAAIRVMDIRSVAEVPLPRRAARRAPS